VVTTDVVAAVTTVVTAVTTGVVVLLIVLPLELDMALVAAEVTADVIVLDMDVKSDDDELVLNTTITLVSAVADRFRRLVDELENETVILSIVIPLLLATVSILVSKIDFTSLAAVMYSELLVFVKADE